MFNVEVFLLEPPSKIKDFSKNLSNFVEHAKHLQEMGDSPRK